MCIFVRKNQSYNKINSSFNCTEQDLDMCAIHLDTKASNLILLSLNRIPSADFT
jgi:hypothetical protein